MRLILNTRFRSHWKKVKKTTSTEETYKKIIIFVIVIVNKIMNYPRYEYSAVNELNIFEFDSIGQKGKIAKIVQYTEMSIKGYYNLGFGDLDLVTREINDEIITNNGDGQKVLATVVSTIYSFTGKNPDAYIYATGSSESRTRLYRMGITNNLEELKKDFHVFGLRNDEEFEPFIIGEDYLGFLIKRKK